MGAIFGLGPEVGEALFGIEAQQSSNRYMIIHGWGRISVRRG